MNKYLNTLKEHCSYIKKYDDYSPKAFLVIEELVNKAILETGKANTNTLMVDSEFIEYEKWFNHALEKLINFDLMNINTNIVTEFESSFSAFRYEISEISRMYGFYGVQRSSAGHSYRWGGREETHVIEVDNVLSKSSKQMLCIYLNCVDSVNISDALSELTIQINNKNTFYSVELTNQGAFIFISVIVDDKKSILIELSGIKLYSPSKLGINKDKRNLSIAIHGLFLVSGMKDK